MRATPIPKQEFGPNGERLCRWCKGLVKPPRRTFCSQDCVDQALIRSSPQHLRRLTNERDKGVCAECGLDTKKIGNRFRYLLSVHWKGITRTKRDWKRMAERYGLTEHRWYNVRQVDAMTEGERRAHRIDKRLKRMAMVSIETMTADLEAKGFKNAVRRYRIGNLWQADHIKPVAEGGGSCGLENIQTLCTPCHKRKTAEQARRRAAERKEKQQPTLDL